MMTQLLDALSPGRLLLLGTAIAFVSYILGCQNGAIIASRLFYHDDVRKHGSGNAGLTNFYRTYGKRNVWLVVVTDMVKAALAVMLGYYAVHLFAPGVAILGKYWAALFVVTGHIYPVTDKFLGGKGILCITTLLLCLDYRIALISGGLFLITFLLTRYVSLASILGVITLPFTTMFIMHAPGAIVVLSAMTTLLVLFAHRDNIKRLRSGDESRFQIRKDREDEA